MNSSEYVAGYVFGTHWDAANIGLYSFAMSSNTTVTRSEATAMGFSRAASGDQSTAIGRNVSTNGHFGSCVIGDGTHSLVANSSADNEMAMRFDGGYNLYSHQLLTTGVSRFSGGNSWSLISDSTKKEHFAKADGEYFLQSISQLQLVEQQSQNLRGPGLVQILLSYVLSLTLVSPTGAEEKEHTSSLPLDVSEIPP
jgi:hypothetical protein